MRYNLIVSMDPNGVIGKDGGIPWYFKEDLEFFKEKTEGNTVVMGHNTWESLPDKFKPLPNRKNAVVTRTLLGEKYLDVSMISSLDSLSAYLAYGAGFNCIQGDVFFIGGSSIYQWALNNVKLDNIYLTITKKEYDGDVVFPVEDYVYYKYKNIPYTTTSEEFDEYIRYHHTFPRKEDV